MGEHADDAIDYFIDHQFFGFGDYPRHYPRRTKRAGLIDGMWVDVRGVKHDPETMDMDHLRNVIAMCERKDISGTVAYLRPIYDRRVFGG